MANDRRRQHNERVGGNGTRIAGTIATCVDRLCVHVQFEETIREGNIDDANSPEPRDNRFEREDRDDIGLLQNGILCDQFDGGPSALLIQVFDFKAMVLDVVRERVGDLQHHAKQRHFDVIHAIDGDCPGIRALSRP